MAYERMGGRTLDYFPCRYDGSNLIFRGPLRPLADRYVAILGGTETFGRFMEEPFSETLELLSGRQTVNLGCVNAGLDAFVADAGVLDICRGAEVTVIQLPGAATQSNAFYKVHPRRNDRFITARQDLLDLFPNVDFSEIHFVGHLLATLQSDSQSGFEKVLRELRAEWIRKMNTLLCGIGGRVILVWMADSKPEAAVCHCPDRRAPDHVNREMLAAVTPRGVDLLEVVATEEEIEAGLERMIFDIHEEPAASRLLGPVVHQEVARQLAALI